MTDRELLELAAKAAGLPGIEYAETVVGTWSIFHDYHDGGKVYWNPLADDGDALRLAVKLGILDKPEWINYRNTELFCTNADALSATRRAITRAAAAIGRNMQ